MIDENLFRIPGPAVSPIDSQVERLKKLAETDGLPPEQRRQKIMEAAREFEAILLQQLLKVMRESMLSDQGVLGGGEGLSAEMYTEVFEGEVARQIASAGTGLGIADMVYNQLGKDPVPAKEAAPVGEVAPAELVGPAEASPGPLRGPITSGYGQRRDPFTNRIAYHKGIDIRAAEGTEVKPALPGTVIFAGRHGGHGNMVALQHDDGTVTRYAHLKEICVKEGEIIDKTRTIGTIGSTGRSTGPHLHFEVLAEGDRPINPGTFLETIA